MNNKGYVQSISIVILLVLSITFISISYSTNNKVTKDLKTYIEKTNERIEGTKSNSDLYFNNNKELLKANILDSFNKLENEYDLNLLLYLNATDKLETKTTKENISNGTLYTKGVFSFKELEMITSKYNKGSVNILKPNVSNTYGEDEYRIYGVSFPLVKELKTGSTATSNFSGLTITKVQDDIYRLYINGNKLMDIEYNFPNITVVEEYQ